jgi:hypothetical protein
MVKTFHATVLLKYTTISLFLNSFLQFCGSALVSIRIRIPLFPQCRSGTNADPDPGQTVPSLKVEFLHEKYTYCR